MKVVAIIQARMGSSRLPGKIMKTIHDKPVILIDIDRVSCSRLIDEIVVAIPYGKENDVLLDTIEHYNNQITVTRGSEDDVLARYYNAAVQTNADVVVRITSDCPMIDPIVMDHVIEQFLISDCDYCSNSLQRTYPRGLDTEVFSFSALEMAYNNAKNDYEREHVTPYIVEKPNRFKLVSVVNGIDISHLRWTLDTEEDFEFINQVYEKIGRSDKMIYMHDFLKIIEQYPNLVDINKHIMQKEVH
ncbi:glycosyltransferase family protein [Methanococcoides sp. SA1]|nr:glycosyltransferase family protein [Methanococcoides sp. SA1]